MNIKAAIPKTPVFAIWNNSFMIRFTDKEETIGKAIRHGKERT
jgi:hypothetical protein